MKTVTGIVSGTFSDEVEIYLDNEEYAEMDEEDIKEALIDGWEFKESDDMDVENVKVKNA